MVHNIMKELKNLEIVLLNLKISAAKIGGPEGSALSVIADNMGDTIKRIEDNVSSAQSLIKLIK